MNAPNANERPPSELSHAMPRQETMIVSKNSSRLRLRTICPNTFGTRYQEAAMTSATIKTDSPNVSRIASPPPSDWPPRIGVNNIMGTTAKS
jgi:hypothetical protein